MRRGRFSTVTTGRDGPREATSAATEDRQSRIVDAAAEVICEEGFDRTRIAQIAERAGVSGGTVIYHFGTLDRLLVHALRRAEQRFHVRAQEIVASGGTPEDRLRRLVAWVFSREDGNPMLWGLWLETWAQAPRHPEVAEGRVVQDERWRALLRDVVADLALEAGAAEDFAISFSALMDGLTIQVALGEPGVDAARATAIAMAHASSLLRW